MTLAQVTDLMSSTVEAYRHQPEYTRGAADKATRLLTQGFLFKPL